MSRTDKELVGRKGMLLRGFLLMEVWQGPQVRRQLPLERESNTHRRGPQHVVGATRGSAGVDEEAEGQVETAGTVTVVSVGRSGRGRVSRRGVASLNNFSGSGAQRLLPVPGGRYAPRVIRPGDSGMSV